MSKEDIREELLKHPVNERLLLGKFMLNRLKGVKTSNNDLKKLRTIRKCSKRVNKYKGGS